MTAIETPAPFDAALLDALMERAGIDVLLANSKHNVAYLLGGYRFFFFDYMDAIGTSRYLPMVLYFRGDVEATRYIGNALEAYEREHGRFWMAEVETTTWGTLDAVARAVAAIEARGLQAPRIGIEAAFLPADAWGALAGRFGAGSLVDALFPLERLRARKSARELAILREASEKMIDAMLAVIEAHGAGTTTRELAEALRLEETRRGLTFEYCLVTSGAGFNRAPSDQVWRAGEIASLDSGGNLGGYIGDLCRMAILGEPDPELIDLLGFVEEVQQAARRPIRPGAPGAAVVDGGLAPLLRSPHRGYTTCVAHGMGLVSHEAPRLTSAGPVPYEGVDAEAPLEAGLVLSIETTMHHPRRGFIKLEDTIAVTRDGFEAFGDRGRGWNRGAV
jgi:Xaa-Pro aminopeptidase